MKGGIRSISRRTLLTGGGVVVLVGLAAWARSDQPSPALAADEAYTLARSGEILLVDIRRPAEWMDTGVPEGAVTLDMRRHDFAAALASLQSAAPDRPVALICARGVRSSRLAARLSGAGVENIVDVREGMLGSRAGPGWLSRDLPTRPGPDAG